MSSRPADLSSDSANDAAPLRMRDLGPMIIEVSGVGTAMRWRKPAQILATLLVSPNRRVSVDTLLDVVWDKQVNDATAGTLESHVWRLRKLMEPVRPRGVEPTYLVNDHGGYRLVVNPEHADSSRFVELAGQGDLLLATGDAARALSRYELALALWRGRPFDLIADTAWAGPSVARLEELHSQVNEQHIEALLRTGAAAVAIPLLEELIAGLPVREGLWRQLMLALYQTRRIEESLAAYGRARESLLENLGLDPGPELHELHQRILNQDPALLPPPPPPPASRSTVIAPAEEAPQPSTEPRREPNLPALRSELVGRDVELTRLTRLLDRARLVTLVGAGGAGKTRLGVEVARAAAGLAPDGVWFVDLAAVDDPELVPEIVMSTLGIAEPTAGTPTAALRSYVRDRQVLLLVDNCEHLLDAVRPLLDAVLDQDSQARVLATSREPLGLDGEVLWTLAPLTVQGDAGTRPDELSASGRLFVSKARSVDATFEADAAALADIEAICSAVDGLPLAIELAAGRIRSATLAEVREQVGAALGELAWVGYTRTEHHRTVELSIEWSVRLLSPPERATHRRLAALPGAFTLEAARAVLDVAPTTARGAAGLLAQLVHRSLLSVVPPSGTDQPTRFRQLATVRAHAASALVDSGELDDVLDRRRRWAEDLVAARPDFDLADTTGWYPRAAQNHDTLAAVLHDALLDRPDSVGVHLLGQLASYWTYQRRVAEGERWSQIALLDTEAPARDLALVELQLAGSFAYRNRGDLAIPLVRSATARADDSDSREYAHFLATAAWCCYLRGDSALGFVQQEVQRVASDDPMIQLWADLLTAMALFTDRELRPALARAEELVERAVSHGHISVAWLASSLAASSALLLHDLTASSTWLKRGITYQRKSGNARDVGLLEFEANLEARAGRYEHAAQLFAQSSTLTFREGSPWPLREWTRGALAQVRQRLTADQFEAAWKHGVARARTVGDAHAAPSPKLLSHYRLTDREQDVAALTVAGLSYAQIARDLFVTQSTVSYHLSNIYAKCGVRSRHHLTELVRSEPTSTG